MNNPEPQRIAVYEPLCNGFEHVPFNTSLLETIAHAFPGAMIRFHAEPEHLAQVGREWALRCPDTPNMRVEWIPLRVGSRHALNWRRWNGERPWCRLLLEQARNGEADISVVTAVSNTGLALLSWVGRRLGDHRVLVFLHSMIEGMISAQPWKPWNWVIAPRQILSAPWPRQLVPVALGAHNEEAVRLLIPHAGRNLRFLEHPYLLRPDTPVDPRPLIFTFVGTDIPGGPRGFDDFAALAARFPAGARFAMAGFVQLQDRPAPPSYASVKDWSDSPLSREEFESRIRTATYVVIPARQERYRISMSASVLDAVSFVRPVIALRTDGLERWWKDLGDIGYLCDDLTGMESLMRSIAERFPSERYAAQRQRILQVRERFAPARIARRLRELTGGCDGEA